MIDQLSEPLRIFSEASRAIRELESSRKNLTVPLNEALDKINQTTKELKAPHEAVLSEAKAQLSAWRSAPEVQEHYANLNLLERKFRTAEKDGDVTGMELVGTHLNELKADCPKSLPCEGGSVRFRELLSITHIDEDVLEERFYKRVVDERAIKAEIELVGAVRGVEFEFSYGAAFYEDKSEQE